TNKISMQVYCFYESPPGNIIVIIFQHSAVINSRTGLAAIVIFSAVLLIYLPPVVFRVIAMTNDLVKVVLYPAIKTLFSYTGYECIAVIYWRQLVTIEGIHLSFLRCIIAWNSPSGIDAYGR